VMDLVGQCGMRMSRNCYATAIDDLKCQNVAIMSGRNLRYLAS
jgi:hypothetical protein